MLVAIDANVVVFALTGKPSLRLLARQWLDALEGVRVAYALRDDPATLGR